MAIIGFIASFIFMVYVSCTLLVIGGFTGLDLGPINPKQYWWFVPLLVLDVWLWIQLFSHAPFTLSIN